MSDERLTETIDYIGYKCPTCKKPLDINEKPYLPELYIRKGLLEEGDGYGGTTITCSLKCLRAHCQGHPESLEKINCYSCTKEIIKFLDDTIFIYEDPLLLQHTGIGMFEFCSLECLNSGYMHLKYSG